MMLCNLRLNLLLVRFSIFFFYLAASSVAWAFWGRLPFTPEGNFTEEAVRRGVQATQAQCNGIEQAVWVTTGATEGECLRYWASQMVKPGQNKRILVFFHGDIWVGAGKTNRDYLENNIDKLQTAVDQVGKRLGVPYVYFSRPGTHGSSGDHMQRRRPVESRLISQALDVLKERWRVEEFVIAGQSGGGHVTASLLTLRSDIVCAVPTSAPASPKMRWQMAGRSIDTTGYADSYEPTQYLKAKQHHPKLRVFILGDPNDKNVFWPTQTVLAEKLTELQVHNAVLQGEGTGPDMHGLSNSSRLVASWCFKDWSTPDIEQRAKQGLKG
jgi:pimeloyl-ACP methyl ester carboxylesterase